VEQTVSWIGALAGSGAETYPDERQGNIDKKLNQPLTLKVLLPC
jgi:hypothetical protein